MSRFTSGSRPSAAGAIMSPMEAAAPSHSSKRPGANAGAAASTAFLDDFPRAAAASSASSPGRSRPGAAPDSKLLPGGRALFSDIDSLAAPGGVSAASPGAVVSAHEQIRRILVAYYICYAPERLTEVPKKIDELVAAEATAEHVLTQMKSDFGQLVPVQGEVLAVLKSSFLTRLYCYFARQNPSMMRNVPHLAQKYITAQYELMADLEVRYGPDVNPMRLYSEEDLKAKEAQSKLFAEFDDDDDDDDEPDDEHKNDASFSNAFASATFDSENNKSGSMSNNKQDAPVSFTKSFTSSAAPQGRHDDDDDEEDDADRGGLAGGGGGFGRPGQDRDGVGGTGAEELAMSRMFLDRLGIDRNKVRPPLPKFQDPAGTSRAPKQMTEEDLELL